MHDRNEIHYDSEMLRHIKIPLVSYVYFTCLESEKVSDEFTKFLDYFIRYIESENYRIKSLDQDFEPDLEFK